MTFAVLPIGDSAVTVEFEERIDVEINQRALALADRIDRAALPGVREVVPTYRSATVYFDPLRTDVAQLMGRLQVEACQTEPTIQSEPRLIRVPVCYGGAFGPDLETVAVHAAMSHTQVIECHSSRTYRVFMLGFVPGFAYMAAVDPRIAMPRRQTPRVRVAAGSIGIAGVQTGIYPLDTPGGWHVIGRTPVKLFDSVRSEPFLLASGDSVRFYPIEPADYDRVDEHRGTVSSPPVREPVPRTAFAQSGMCAHVIRPGLQTTVQDLGRWGWQARGVPVAGPMDLWSHRVANALAGNPAVAATLEITVTGPELEFEDDRVAAVAGADFVVTVDGQAMPPREAFRIQAGSRLKFGARMLGTRAYLAIAGGIDVPPTLGSRATHLPSRLGGLGGRALESGDRLPLGSIPPRSIAVRAIGANGQELGLPLSSWYSDRLRPNPNGGLDGRLRVLPGPQAGWFAASTLDVLQSAPYRLTSNSNRMGFRLDGPLLHHVRDADMISEATPLGSLQVPASGLPILLMADRQTTGGYPSIVVVISADMPVAGQLGPGDLVSFELCEQSEAVAALAAEERPLAAIETQGPGKE